MRKLNRDKNLLFTFALFFSIMFVPGILGIVFGATNDMTFLLVLGIVFVVVGFYIMPILWVMFGNLVSQKRILIAIEKEHLLNVADLANHLNKNEQEIRKIILKFINKMYLQGYSLIGDNLVPIKKKSDKLKFKCPNCGGSIKFENNNIIRCEYCNSVVDKGVING